MDPEKRAGRRMSHLFSEFHIKGVSLRNRIVVSPMCQYSADDGVPNDWHMVHLGARAIGGAALVIAEATAVSPEGRITPGCTGLWNDKQAEAWAPIMRFIKKQGAVPGIQIAHAGRKASANKPWEGDDHMSPDDPRSWDPLGPSPIASARFAAATKSLCTRSISSFVISCGARGRFAPNATGDGPSGSQERGSSGLM